MSSSDSPFDRGATLRMLGEPHGLLDGLLRLLDEEWARFRARPEPAELARLERVADAIASQFRAVETLLDAAARREGAATPREAVERTAAPPGPSRESGDEAAVRPPPGAPRAYAPGPRRVAGPIADETAVVFPPFRDQATGLLSREGFDAAASGELKSCRRHERPFALLLVQVGVPEAEALRRSATALRGALRESDLAGRHVNRTFALGLGETALSAARLVAERLIGVLEAGGAWDPSGRVGLAGYPIDGETLPGLLEVARGQLSLPPDEVLAPTRQAG